MSAWIDSVKAKIDSAGLRESLGALTEKTKAGLAATKQGISSLTDNVLTATPTTIYQLQDGRKFRLRKTLSTAGRYGEIFLVEEVDSMPPRLYVLKRMVIHPMNLKAIKSEIAMMKLASGHKNVVRLEGYVSSAPRGVQEAALIIEYCSGGSLLDYINSRLQNPMKEDEVLRIFLDLCMAVEHLHSLHIIHRDIKIENLLRHSSGSWKLGDFGSATQQVMLAKTESEREAIGADIEANTTMAYRAPEMVDLFRNQPISEKADVWALGCALYKMAFNLDAFDQGKLQIINNKFSIPKFHRFSPKFIELIPFILNADPEKRPATRDVIQRIAELLSIPCPTVPIQAEKPEPTPAPIEEPTIAVPVVAKAPSPAPVFNATQKQQKASTDVLSTLQWEDNSAEPAQVPVEEEQSTPAAPSSGFFQANFPEPTAPAPIEPHTSPIPESRTSPSPRIETRRSPSPRVENRAATRAPRAEDILAWEENSPAEKTTSPDSIPPSNKPADPSSFFSFNPVFDDNKPSAQPNKPAISTKSQDLFVFDSTPKSSPATARSSGLDDLLVWSEPTKVSSPQPLPTKVTSPQPTAQKQDIFDLLLAPSPNVPSSANSTGLKSSSPAISTPMYQMASPPVPRQVSPVAPTTKPAIQNAPTNAGTSKDIFDLLGVTAAPQSTPKASSPALLPPQAAPLAPKKDLLDFD